jgi:hypothetical protein
MNSTKTRPYSEASGGESVASKSFKRQKVAGTGALGVTWYQKQDAAFLQATDDTMPLKLGMYQFGNYPDRNDFAQDWCLTHRQESHPVYELLLEGSCRLYFDIEAEHDGEKPPDRVLKAWLASLVAEIKVALQTSGVSNEAFLEDVLVGYDCRPKSDGSGYKRSFHLVYPSIIFNNNHTDMKKFVLEMVMPRVKKKTEFKWIAEQKNGDVVKYAIDPLVYTHNRAWRVMYARKQGKTAMTPWNLDTWREMEFESDQQRQDWFERSLCGRADTEDFEGVVMQTQAQPAPSSSSSSASKSKNSSVPAVVSAYITPPQLDPGTKVQRQFATKACAFLSDLRRTDVNAWMKVGYALASIFGKNAEGLVVFHQFSAAAPNYDKDHCDQVYKGAGSRIGIGSLIMWLREDHPAIAPALEAQCRDVMNPDVLVQEEEELEAQAAQERSTPEDHRVNEQMMDSLNEQAQQLKARRKRQLKEKKHEAAAMTQNSILALEQRIFDHLNKFLCAITKGPKTVFIEQYATESLQPERTIRDGKCLKEAFRDQPWLTSWMKSLRRKAFDNITFDPSHVGHSKYKFNLFGGLAHPKDSATLKEYIEMEMADLAILVKPLLDHILRVWCKGNSEVNKYVLDWQAHAVQFPWIKMAVALVLRGDEGAGKGIVVDFLSRVLGLQHFYQVHDAENSIFGRFTPKNFEQCLLLFVDEAVWGGSHSQAGKLKKLVTEMSHDIENKYGARFSIASFMNIIFASNEDWVIPAGYKARRWLCLDIDNRHAGINNAEGNRSYFAAIRKVPVEAWAAFLHRRDISAGPNEFHCRDVPATEMLRDQKLRRFDSVIRFWEHCLKQGAIFPETDSRHNQRHPWPAMLSTDDLHDCYRQHGAGVTGLRVVGKDQMVKQLGVVARLENIRMPEDTFTGKRYRGKKLPSLAEARVQFCAKVDDPAWFEKNDELKPVEEI